MDKTSSYIQITTTLYTSKKLAEPIYCLVKSKLSQQDPTTMRVFETFSWSNNEKALIEQIYSLISEEKDDFPEKTSEKPLKFKRPCGIAIPFNRELSYYSTMDSQNSCNLKTCGENSETQNNLLKINRTEAMNFVTNYNEISQEVKEETEDLDFSFESMGSSGEDTGNHAKKLQFVRNMGLAQLNLQSFKESCEESP